MGAVTVAVMASDARAKWAHQLAADLDATITWDQIGSRWDTGRRAWLSVANARTRYAMVIQDDAIPAAHLLEELPRILAYVPNKSPLVLYSGSTRLWNPVWRTLPKTTGLMVMANIWWGPAIILPTNMIRTAVAAGDAIAATTDQYDHLIGTWFQLTGIPIYYAWPSLVNHRDGPSLVAGRGGNRAAHRFIADARQWAPGVTVKVDAPAGT